MFVLIGYREHIEYDRDYNIDRVNGIFEKQFVDADFKDDEVLHVHLKSDASIDAMEFIRNIDSYKIPYYLNDMKRCASNGVYYTRSYNIIPLNIKVDDIYDFEEFCEQRNSELNAQYMEFFEKEVEAYMESKRKEINSVIEKNEAKRKEDQYKQFLELKAIYEKEQ